MTASSADRDAANLLVWLRTATYALARADTEGIATAFTSSVGMVLEHSRNALKTTPFTDSDKWV